jgi:D-alanyl-D-alanine carboxypeptidase
MTLDIEACLEDAMRRATALVTVLSAAALLACSQDPVGQSRDPQLTLSADSIVVEVGAYASVSATVRNTIESAQFVSRDQGVANVSAGGLISGVAPGSTYVVATLSNHADVRDSVRVRVETHTGTDPQAVADSAFVAALRARLENDTNADEFSGAVLVIRDQRTLFAGAYGHADREQGVPNTLLTQFRVGSMNKMLTAVAVLQLVQAGTVRLDAPLNTYLPNYPNAELASKVTPHHLLTHTGGTGDIFGPEFVERRSELRTTDDYLRLYGTRGLRFEPGTRFEYSNYGFMLLGAVIERVTRMSYDDYVAAHVLAPAGMTATGAAPEDSLVPNRSVGYTRLLVPGWLLSNAPLLPYRGTAAGGWYSTVGDFASFTAALRENKLLDAAHTALLLSGKVPMGSSGIVRYAYGFIDRVQVGRRLVGHGGSFPGMSGELSFEPNGRYVVVVLSNFDPPAAARTEAFILNRLPN